MGKNRNYNAKPVPEEVVEEKVEVVEAPVEDTIAEEEVVPVEPVEEVENTANAVVNGVEMLLNIRKNPEIAANNQIAMLGNGSKIIVVDPDKTEKNKDGEWYKVRLFGRDKKDPDANGYAMKMFIKVV